MNTELVMLIAFAQAKQIAGEWALSQDEFGAPAYTWKGDRNGIARTYWLRFTSDGFDIWENFAATSTPVRSLGRLLDFLKHGY